MKLYYAIFFTAHSSKRDYKNCLVETVLRGRTHPRLYQRKAPMKYASAYYVVEPYAEIYVFVDEPPSDVPENALLICEETNPKKFLSILEPYFVYGYEG